MITWLTNDNKQRKYIITIKFWWKIYAEYSKYCNYVLPYFDRYTYNSQLNSARQWSMWTFIFQINLPHNVPQNIDPSLLSPSMDHELSPLDPCCLRLSSDTSHLWYLHENIKCDKSYNHYSLKKTTLITMKICTYQDSSAVLVCAKFHCDHINISENINEHISIKFVFLWKFH